MIDIAAIRARFTAMVPFLDERTRRLLAASEARTAGRGGITAASSATGVAPGSFGSPLYDGGDGLAAVFGEVFETLDNFQSHPA
jgi:hypothetical protein